MQGGRGTGILSASLPLCIAVSGKEIFTMKAKWLLCVTVALCAMIVEAASLPKPARSASSLTITAKTTLVEVVERLRPFTSAQIVIAEKDKELARRYTFPPHLVGRTLKLSPATDALKFLTSAGWEGSPLPANRRGKAGAQWQLARTPYAFEVDGQKIWNCNNRQWDWRWEKSKGKSAGGTITVFSRLQPDGDVVEGKKFKLSEVQDDSTFETLLDLMKQKTGVTVNFVPYDSQFLEVKATPAPESPARRAESKRVPMRAAAIPPPLRERLTEELTPGEFLSIIALGLNHHTRPMKTDWRWSSDKRSSGEVIYTLRDYAHVAG